MAVELKLNEEGHHHKNKLERRYESQQETRIEMMEHWG
jgi:hypothetical protein